MIEFAEVLRVQKPTLSQMFLIDVFFLNVLIGTS